MASPRKTYLIQRQQLDKVWVSTSFQSGSKNYCDGYLDAMDSMYPSAPYRIITYDDQGIVNVYRETRGRSSVHTN